MTPTGALGGPRGGPIETQEQGGLVSLDLISSTVVPVQARAVSIGGALIIVSGRHRDTGSLAVFDSCLVILPPAPSQN